MLSTIRVRKKCTEKLFHLFRSPINENLEESSRLPEIKLDHFKCMSYSSVLGNLIVIILLKSESVSFCRNSNAFTDIITRNRIIFIKLMKFIITVL